MKIPERNISSLPTILSFKVIFFFCNCVWLVAAWTCKCVQRPVWEGSGLRVGLGK